MPASQPPLPFATLLDGRYRLKASLGRGGMGEVYEAEDIRLGRRVAVKVLHPGCDERLIERLVREAKLGAGVDHPAIATVFSYGTDTELAIDYIAMERLHGETLEQRLAKVGRLAPTWVTQLGLEIADGLAAVHAAGVIHRDMKPSNVFLATRGRRVDEIKLLDFGVAKAITLQTLTDPGQVLGTPMYMAPEQLLGAASVDPRTDVYAVGCVLFESLAGQRPYKAESAIELSLQITRGPQPSLRDRCPELSDALVRVVDRCMRKRPDDRYPSARALFDALRALAAGPDTRPGP